MGHVWTDDGSVIRHGAEFDPCWCEVEAAAGHTAGVGDNAWSADWLGVTRPRPPLLGESVVVDLVARFAASTLDHGPAITPVARLIGRLSSAAPLAIPSILANWHADRHEGVALAAGQRQRVESEWRRAVAAWHREARRLPPASGIEACPVDWLAGWFEQPATAPAPADVAARFAPRPPRLGRSVVSLVLGHIGTMNEAGVADLIRDGVVCLGHEPSGGQDPPTVARAGRSWSRLAVAAPGAASRQTAAVPFATIRPQATSVLSAARSSIDADDDANAAA